MRAAEKFPGVHVVESWGKRAAREDRDINNDAASDTFILKDGPSQQVKYLDANFRTEYRDEHTNDIRAFIHIYAYVVLFAPAC